MHIEASTNNDLEFNRTDFTSLVTCRTTCTMRFNQNTMVKTSSEQCSTAGDLATVNPTVKAAFDASENGLTAPSATNMAGSELALTQDIMDEHMALLKE